MSEVRDLHYVYPGDKGYPAAGLKVNGGNDYPILREQAGLQKYIDPSEYSNYKDGDANPVQATEDQKALARKVTGGMDGTQESRTQAYNELVATCNGNTVQAAGILQAYSLSDS